VEVFSWEWLRRRGKDGGLLVEPGRRVVGGALVGVQVEAFPGLGKNGSEVAPETCTRGDRGVRRSAPGKNTATRRKNLTVGSSSKKPANAEEVEGYGDPSREAARAL
jgi:hypothetical protein